MMNVLESINIDILNYLLDKFCPLFEWDIITYFISLAVNIQSEDKKFVLYQSFLNCDFAINILLGYAKDERYIWL
jgi:hypothetical protein